MGCTLSDMLIRSIAEKVIDLMDCYERDFSFTGIEDKDLVYFPKKFLMHKVRAVDLEFVWHRLPECFRTDEDLLQCRPCLKHYGLEGVSWSTYIDSVPRKKDCSICKYNNL